MKFRAVILAAATTICLLALLHVAHASDTRLAGAQVRVVDGDTLVIRATGERIRFENIDAPELYGRCADEIDRANRAKAFVIAMLEKYPVVVHRMTKRPRDKYGRTLALIELVGVGDLGREEIRVGLAREYHGGKRAGWCG
jgi:micrococcal nuclease